MRTSILISAFLFVFHFASTAQTVNTDVSQFDWMLGVSKGAKDNGVFTESWERTSDELLLGTGVMVVNGNNIFSEELRIQKIGKYWCYIPMINGNPPTMFVMIKSKPNYVVFENKEHDFPQRIGYKIDDQNNFVAWIEGEYKGKFSSEETVMQKDDR